VSRTPLWLIDDLPSLAPGDQAKLEIALEEMRSAAGSRLATVDTPERPSGRMKSPIPPSSAFRIVRDHLGDQSAIP